MKPILQVEHVTFERRHRTILCDVSWTVNPREHWVILGLNGSGKTSLLTLILGYEWPTQGRIEVLGQTYGQVDLRQIRPRIGWVSHHLSEWMTRDHGQAYVRDLVASGQEAVIGKARGPVSDNDVDHALQQFDLTAQARQRFASLSQGEKTRVLLSRAWMARVELLVLDEPCSGLDIRGRESFLSLLSHYPEQQSVHLLYVTHHPEEILPLFTHALILKNGVIIQKGPIDSVLTGPALSEAFEVPITVATVNGRRWLQVVAP